MSIILIILMIMFSGFMVSSSAETATVSAVPVDGPIAVSIIDTPVDDDLIYIFEVAGHYQDADTEVSLSFANISGTDLQSVDVTVGCLDADGTILESTTVTYADVINDSMTVDRDILFTNQTCAELTAEVTDVTP